VLHIILLILKILGCIILGILALILALLLIVLFVPFRYELSLAYDDFPEAEGRVSWLFGLLKAYGGFKDKKLQAKVSVLWFHLLDTGKKNEDTVSETLKGDVQDAAFEVEDFVEDIASGTPKEEKTSAVEAIDASEPERVPEPSQKTEVKSSQKAEQVEAVKPVKKTEHLEKEKKASAKRVSKKAPKKPSKKKTAGFFERLEAKLSSIEKKYETFEAFLSADDTQGSLEFAKCVLLSLWRHMRPKKMSGYIHFGFDRPGDTGRVLGYASILHAWYGDSLILRPDFEESALDGSICIKGSIQLYIFLYWGLRGLLSKDIRKMIKRIKHIKGKEETLWQ
jgi:hypothetical protein